MILQGLSSQLVIRQCTTSPAGPVLYLTKRHGTWIMRRGLGGVPPRRLPQRRPGAWDSRSDIRSPSCTQMRFLSSSSSSSTTPMSAVANLRNYIKPFLLQCHPDVFQTAAPDAQQVNLNAVQTLNAFLDTMESVAAGKKLSRSTLSPSGDSHDGIEIEFIIMVEDRRKAVKKATSPKHRPTTSRRRVALVWPDADAPDRPAYLIHHVSQQVAKLLRVAGLDVPAELQRMETAAVPTEQDDDRYATSRYYASSRRKMDQDDIWAHVMDVNEETQRLDRDLDGRTQGAYGHYQSLYRQRAAEQRRFTNSIDWDKFDKLYRQAWAEAEADMATHGLIRNNRERRRNFIADICARVVYDRTIPVVDRFCAMRKLSIILEQNFDRLELEESGAFWEKVTIHMTSPRTYNTSASAMHKRRLKHADDGFLFALQSNGQVSLQIPIDYREDELLQQWDRNLSDFYALTGDDMNEIFL